MSQLLSEIQNIRIETELRDVGCLRPGQLAKLNAVLGIVALLKLKNTALFRSREDLQRHLELNVRKNSGAAITVDKSALKYLTREDCAYFERNGILGPLVLLQPEEARALRAHIEATAFSSSNPLYAILRRSDPADADEMLSTQDIILGVNMFMYDSRVRETLCRERMVGIHKELMGTDQLYLWRSQIFRQYADQRYTFYHQNVDFSDNVGHTSLYLKKAGAFQPHSALNSWISLSESQVDNGTMSVLCRSFLDTRVYDLQKHFLNNVFDLLNTLSFFPMNEVKDMLTIFLYSKGGHRGKSKLLVKLAQFCYDDLFKDGYQKVDLIAKPGEYYVFTSFNMHGSYPTQPGRERFTLVGRYVDARMIDTRGNHVLLPSKKGVVRFNPRQYEMEPFTTA